MVKDEIVDLRFEDAILPKLFPHDSVVYESCSSELRQNQPCYQH